MSDEREQDAVVTTIGPRVDAAQLELDIDAVSRRTRKFVFEQQNTIDRLTAELKTANADRDDLVDRLCAVAGEHESLASGEVSRELLSENARLTAERDQAREQLAKLRGMLATLLDAFGTPATRQTEVNLAMALSVYEAEGMKEESHVLRATIEAINAVLGIESEAGE